MVGEQTKVYVLQKGQGWYLLLLWLLFYLFKKLNYNIVLVSEA